MIEANSPFASECVAGLRDRALVSWLSEVELRNSFELRVFRREISAAEARDAGNCFLRDSKAGSFQLCQISREIYDAALDLAAKHTAELGVRSLGILHVAAAIQSGADAFWTFDQRQAQLARAAGLKTLP